MTNTTLLRENAAQLDATLDFLADLHVPTVGLNALIYAGRGQTVGTGLHESALPPLLELARGKTESAGQRLIWYTPTQYCHFDPVQMQLGVKGCTAAMYNLCVEPDGAVLPCQSYYEPWAICCRTRGSRSGTRTGALAARAPLRAEGCRTCAVLAECGGGCPLTLAHQAPLQVPVLTAA